MAICLECGKPVVRPYPTNDGTILHSKCALRRAARSRDRAWTKSNLAMKLAEDELASPRRDGKR